MNHEKANKLKTKILIKQNNIFHTGTLQWQTFEV